MAVVGAGWAGLAAAVRATAQGHAVTLHEMAPQLGGRARRVDVRGLALDNGQHILIGAYRETLALMRQVGVDVDAAFDRRALALVYPDGSGLRLPAGPPVAAFVRGVLGWHGWRWQDRLAVLAAAARWRAAGFTCDPAWTVERLVRSLPRRAQAELIAPLCVAALNTPFESASATVFLRVLQDALFGGAGGADLLLPRQSLGRLLPEPAAAWLDRHGAARRTGRVAQVEPLKGRWRVDAEVHDAVVLACSVAEAARLAEPWAPAWAAAAAAFEYEPIVTVYLQSAGTALPQPMTALRADDRSPAQFVFDHGALGGMPGLFAFVVSGARIWLEQGVGAVADAVQAQALAAFASGTWKTPPERLQVIAERRATFLCTPGLRRPPTAIVPGLAACGDYVDGPYPATLEGAVRSGLAAVRSIETPGPH